MKSKIIYACLVLSVLAVLGGVIAICGQNSSLKNDLAKCLDSAKIKAEVKSELKK